MNYSSEPEEAPVPLPITGELDLHTFRPSDLGELIPAYLAACAARQIREVRIVHGKGTGTLRTGVHAALARMEVVESFTWPAGALSGGWGATWAHLRR